MTVGILSVVIAAVFAAALVLTAGLRRYALRTKMIDMPGPRSSHAAPTPRGGGASIVLCVLVGTLALLAVGMLSPLLAWALLGGGSLVAFVGWLDDRRGLPQWLRASAYLLAAVIAIAVLGGVHDGGARMTWYVANAAAVLGIGWLTNLYNFMDGTDGLAAVEAVSCAAWAAFLLHVAGATGAAWLCVVIASSAAGFLYWNRPPAKIFMGDSGSCFIGFCFGVLAVATHRADQVPLPVWFILLALFVCDASFTLLRRALAGEKWYRPHRTHAYQLLVQSNFTHARLAICVLALNSLLLGPLALWACRQPDLAPIIAAAVGAGLFLLWAAIQFRHKQALARAAPE